MARSQTPEYMDCPTRPQQLVDAFHRDLSKLNLLLGNTQYMLTLLAKDPPVSLIDIGCGQGSLLSEVRAKLGISGTGVDLRPASVHKGVTILQADATKELLPFCDVAICVLTVHHLEPEQVSALVRNVGRFAKRLVILDLVRHPLPRILFKFLRPLTTRLVFEDGVISLRRAYTPQELRSLVVDGLEEMNSTFRHWVSPVWAKQVIDIRY